MNEAHAGDVVALVSCCRSGPRFVRQSTRPTWRCSRCGSGGFDLTAVVLGERGAIPTPERDDALVTPDRGDVNTNRAVSSAVAAGL